MTEINSRRPGGYHGAPAKIAALLMEDARAALECCRELRARAERGECVMGEVMQEAIDSGFRGDPLGILVRAGLGSWMLQIIIIEEQASMERIYAMRPPPHSRAGEERIFREALRTATEQEKAARFMVDHAGVPRMSLVEIMEDPKTALRAYRRAAKSLHPDVGGDTRKMQELVNAKEALDRGRN